MYLKESCFPDCWKVSLVIPVFKNAGGKQTTENLDVINKAFKKVVIGLFIAWRNVAFFLISNMVLGLLNQLQIFWYLYLMELPGFSIGLGLLELYHLIYSRHSTGFGMLVFFPNLCLMEFWVRYLALYCPFSLINAFKWFWMGGLQKILS